MCIRDSAGLEYGGCGGDDPLWLGRAGSGRRGLSSLFAGSFIFPSRGVPHGQKYAVPDPAPVSYTHLFIELTPMEFDVFHLLARRPGRVFSQREIYEFVAPDSFDSSWTGIRCV